MAKKTYTLYIGSNNTTRQLELDRIKAITGRNHEGFTLFTATGAWLGTEEATAVLIIHDDPARIMETINSLKRELNQDAIGYQIAPTLHLA